MGGYDYKEHGARRGKCEAGQKQNDLRQLLRR